MCGVETHRERERFNGNAGERRRVEWYDCGSLLLSALLFDFDEKSSVRNLPGFISANENVVKVQTTEIC